MAGAHKKLHPINSTADHSGGTNNTLVGTDGGGTLTELGYGTAATANNIPQRDADGHVNLPAYPGTPAEGSEAITADQAQAQVDAAIQGLTVKGRVEVGNMIDDSLVTSPGSPNTGDSYVVAGIGGLWSGFLVGDIVTWDGAAWQVVLANATGTPPDGTRVLVTGTRGSPYTTATAAGSFAGQTDKIGVYTVGSGWAFDGPGDSWTVEIGGELEPFENYSFYYDQSPTPGWYTNSTGSANHNALMGIQGGSASERYHLTNAEYLRSLAHKADFALAGTEPVAADFTTGGITNNGDWAFGYGTGGAVFHMARVNGVNVAVELTVIT